MGYNLGALNQRVTIESQSTVPDGAGGATGTWSTLDTVWAMVRPLRGDERENAQRREGTGDYLVVMRNRDDVLPKYRLGWRSRKLNITFIRARGPRTEFLEIEARIGGSS